MSWLFSQALVEEYLDRICLDGEQFVQSKSNRTQLAYLHLDKMTMFSGLSQFGMTLKPLTENRGKELLTLYLEDFRAKTLVTQEIKPEFLGNEADCGKKWPASFARYSHDSYLWKTSQRCLIEGWASFSGTWPRWGFMRDWECWELPTSAVFKPEKGFGFWPTLKASDGNQYSKNLSYFERRLKISPDLPVIAALSSPPTVKGYYGRLNPDWCEWLTGFPVGWTELKPLATDKIQELRQRHYKFFATKVAA